MATAECHFGSGLMLATKRLAGSFAGSQARCKSQAIECLLVGI